MTGRDENERHETAAGWSVSKRGSVSNGLQSVTRPSDRPTANIACPPSVEEKERDVTWPANVDERESGVFTPRASDQR